MGTLMKDPSQGKTRAILGTCEQYAVGELRYVPGSLELHPYPSCLRISKQGGLGFRV